VWLLFPAVVILRLVGLVAWSCYQPVRLQYESDAWRLCAPQNTLLVQWGIANLAVPETVVTGLDGVRGSRQADGQRFGKVAAGPGGNPPAPQFPAPAMLSRNLHLE
jgi:hypothetical protein